MLAVQGNSPTWAPGTYTVSYKAGLMQESALEISALQSYTVDVTLENGSCTITMPQTITTNQDNNEMTYFADTGDNLVITFTDWSATCAVG